MAVLNKLSVPIDGQNEGTAMPKLQYRFRVTFNGMGNSNLTDKATNNVISVTRPNMTHDEVLVDTYNSRIYLAGKHTWEPVTIELRDDINNETSFILDQQIARQIDMANQSSQRAGQGYKFEISIENLDGGNPDPVVLDTWILSGCYLQNLTYNDTNYASGGEYQSISIQIRYDNAEHIMHGVDSLTGADHDATASGATN